MSPLKFNDRYCIDLIYAIANQDRSFDTLSVAFQRPQLLGDCASFTYDQFMRSIKMDRPTFQIGFVSPDGNETVKTVVIRKIGFQAKQINLRGCVLFASWGSGCVISSLQVIEGGWDD